MINFTDEWEVIDYPIPDAQEKKSVPSAQEDNDEVASDEVINTSGMFASIAAIAAISSNVVSFAANTLFSAIGSFAADDMMNTTGIHFIWNHFSDGLDNTMSNAKDKNSLPSVEEINDIHEAAANNTNTPNMIAENNLIEAADYLFAAFVVVFPLLTYIAFFAFCCWLL